MKKYLHYVIGIIAILLVGYFFVVKTVMPSYIQKLLPQVETLSQDYINGSVKIGSVTWNGGLTAEITDIVVVDKHQEKVAELPKTVVTFKPWKALQKTERALAGVDVYQPKVYLTMNKENRWNMQDLLKPSDSTETPFYGLLKVQEGTLIVATPYGKWDFGVEASVDGGANPKFAIEALIKAGKDELSAKGLVDSKGIGTIDLQSKSLAVAPYASALQHFVDIQGFQGTIQDVALRIDNNGEKVQLSGEGKAKGITGILTYNEEQHNFVVDAAVSCADNQLTLKALDITVDEQKAHVEGKADVTDWENVSGQGVLTAPALAYGDYSVENVKVAFYANKDLVQIIEASLNYGDGSAKGSATLALKDKALAADLTLKNIHYALSDNDVVQANGDIAVLAKMKGANNYEIHAAADTFSLGWRSLLINKFSVDGNYVNDTLAIEHLSMSSENGDLLASGTVTKDGDLNLKGRMSNFPVHPLLVSAGVENAKGYCSTSFNIGGNLKAPEFKGMIQLQKADIMGIKLTEAHGMFMLHNNVVTLKKLKANMEQGTHFIDGTVDMNGAEPLMDLSLETKGVRVEPMAKLVLPELPLTGNLDNVMEIKGTPSNLSVRGEMNLTDGSANNFYLIDQIKGKYFYENNQLRLQDFVAKSLGSEVKIDGILNTVTRSLNFTIDANKVDLNGLPIQEMGVSLAGLVNFKGHLTGTLSNPYFEGDLKSQEAIINGETIANLQGKITSNTANVNHVEVSFEQPYKKNVLKKGTYKADLNLNLQEKFMDGKVNIHEGDLAGILRLAKLDYAIEGVVNGSLDFCPKGKGSGVIIDSRVSEVKIHDLDYYGMDFKGRFNDWILYLDDVKLQEKADVLDKGILKATGSINTQSKNLNITVDATKINPALVTAVMKNPPAISGETDLNIRLMGSYADLRNLHGDGTVTIFQGSVAGVAADSVTAIMTLDNDVLNVKKLVGVKDIYSVTGEGQIPLDLFRDKASRYNPQAEMNIKIDLNNARLGILPAFSKMIEWAVGDIKGIVTIGGTLEEPLLYGSAKIDEGSIKVKYLDTIIDKVHLDAEFKGNKVELKDLSAHLGKGKLVIDGSYALRTRADEEYRLHVLADNAQITSDVFTGRINSEMAVVPQKYIDFKNHKGNTPPPIKYRPLIKGKLKLDDVLLNIASIPDFGEGESNYGLDIAFKLGPRIHMENPYLYDIWLSGGLDIKGSTLFPVISGKIKAEKGSISYLRTSFKLKDASLAWITPGSFLPNVTLDGSARFSRYTIFMHIDGPVDTMNLKMTSNPALEQKTIVRMLTLQRDSSSNNSVGSNDMTNIVSAGLQMTVLGDVEMLIKQTLGLDQFRIYNGKVRTGVGFENTVDMKHELTEDEKKQYNIIASKFITSHIQVGYTTSFNSTHNSYFGGYEFSRKFNITYSRTKDMSETKDWYGLEYTLNF